jgi:hypothetical protein
VIECVCSGELEALSLAAPLPDGGGSLADRRSRNVQHHARPEVDRRLVASLDAGGVDDLLHLATEPRTKA